MIAKLMRDRKIVSVVLIEKGKSTGIIKERGLVYRVMVEKKDQSICLAEDVALSGW